MRILHIVRQFSPSLGGLENYVRAMATNQADLGHSCEVLTLNRVFETDRGALPDRDVVDDVPVRRVPFIGGRRMFVPIFSNRIFDNYDVLHVHSTDGMFDSLGLRRVNVPMVATTHGGFFHTRSCSKLKGFYFDHITARTCRSYGRLFANSRNDLAIFSKIHSEVTLEPNSIEPIGDFTAAGSDILYLGRLAQHKGLELLIRAFAEMSQQDRGRLLHIVGPEWDVRHDTLRALAADLGVLGSVRLHGHVSSARLQDICRRCGFFCSASAFEGFGMSLVEAMSVGLIPIVHKNASFQELIAAASVGTVTDFSDAGGAAKGMRAQIRSATGEDRERARRFAQTFAWPDLARRTVEAYHEVGNRFYAAGCVGFAYRRAVTV